MMFWDSSALIALVIQERYTAAARDLLREDREIAVWALTSVEIASGLGRRYRSGELSDVQRHEAWQATIELEGIWHAVGEVAQVGRRACRLLANHALRAADSCQLAAALVLCGERPENLRFVTTDERLAEAARREGFVVPVIAG